MIRTILIACLCLLTLPIGAMAQSDVRTSLAFQVEEVIAGLDFTGIEPMEIPCGKGSVSMRAIVRSLASGEMFSGEDCVSWVLGAFFDELSGMGALMASIMLPVLLSGLLMQMLLPQRKSLILLTRSVCFMLVLIPVLLLVFSQMEHARQTITAMTQRMDKLLPMLLTL